MNVGVNVELIAERIANAITNGIREECKRMRKDLDGEITVTRVVQCLRKSFFEITQRKEDEGNYSVLVGLISHYVIERLIETEFAKDCVVRREAEVSYDVLKGHVDVLLECKGAKYVVEIKTTKSKPIQPYPLHERQARIYDTMVGAEYAFIVYVNRADGSIKIFTVTPDTRALELAVTRAKMLKKALETGVPPEPEFTPQCFLCPFRSSCNLRTVWW